MTSRRFYRLFSSGLGLFLSQTALAIGIGDLAVDSYVNEPLSARIAILDPKDVSESEVIASLASLADFERLDVERHYSLSSLVFEADIYVAYGRHQHALDTLEAASAAEPTNASGLLKMLEIYISLDRIEEAQGLLQAIEQSGDRDALLTAADQLSNISGVLTGDSASQALAAEVSPPEVAVDSEASLDVDISLDIEFQEAAQPESVTPKESDASSMLDTEEDPAETALDLARAYLDMGDKTGAKELLETAISMGDDAQVEVAKQLLASIE